MCPHALQTWENMLHKLRELKEASIDPPSLCLCQLQLTGCLASELKILSRAQIWFNDPSKKQLWNGTSAVSGFDSGANLKGREQKSLPSLTSHRWKSTWMRTATDSQSLSHRHIPRCANLWQHNNNPHLAHKKVVVKWVRNGREGAFPEEAAGCLRATELQDYRGAKMNVTKTTNVHRVAEKGWYHLNSLRACGTACGAEVDYPPEREHSYMSLRLTCPHF